MEFDVPDMSCGHCVGAIEKSIAAIDPAARVACDLQTHRVRIDSHLAADDLRSAIEKAGYASQAVPA